MAVDSMREGERARESRKNVRGDEKGDDRRREGLVDEKEGDKGEEIALNGGVEARG